jgi:DNA-binding winged helix-turn-helix (wHTH) protein
MNALTLDQWRLSPEENRLYRGGERVELQPRCMSLLNYMAQRPGQVISRQELLDAVWSGRIVGEDALNNCVRKLRRALDDNPRKPRIIETINKRGYRLIAPVGRPWFRLLRKHRSSLAAMVAVVALCAFAWNHSSITVYRFSDSDTLEERQAKLEKMAGQIESADGEVKSLSVSLHDRG